jgi:predicted lactoylglutathione lyase
MTRKIFVNLPVKDLERSMTFFKQLGFKFNPQFTDHTAACMVIADDIYAMLLTHPKFKMFTKKEIADATRFTEVLTALSFESKAQVNEFVDAALKAGAIESGEVQDHGFMYGRSFDDLDGHTWEIFWMDPNHIQKT